MQWNYYTVIRLLNKYSLCSVTDNELFIFLRVVVGRQGCNQLGATLLLHFFRRRRRHRSTLNWFVPDANIFLFAQHQYFVASLYNVYLWFTLICTQGCAKIGSFLLTVNIFVVLDTHSWYFILFNVFNHTYLFLQIFLPCSWTKVICDPVKCPITDSTLPLSTLHPLLLRAGIDIVKSWKTWRGKSRSWENFLQGKVF